MKVVFDNIIFSLQKMGGISVYWCGILNRVGENFKFLCYEKENDNILSSDLVLDRYRETFLPIKIVRYLPFVNFFSGESIFHSSYYRVSLQKGVANITTVHDFTYEYFYSGIAQKTHSWQKNFAIRHSSGIICVSENTKKDLIKFVPDLDPLHIKVIYNGVGEEFCPIDTFDNHFDFEVLLNIRFILFVGDRSPYKNFDKVVGVVKQFPELSLVVVGGKDFSPDEEIMLTHLRGRYFRFAGVSGEELNWLYNHAFCFLYPSSYEGFGIPVIEAMKAGCPVISTNTSSIPEVAGDAALLVDKPTVELLSEQVNLLFDDSFRNGLRLKGFSQASKFSWDKCFEETMAFYQEVWEREFGDKD